MSRTATGSDIYIEGHDGVVPHYVKDIFNEKTGKMTTVTVTDFVFDPVATIALDEDNVQRVVFVVEVLGEQFQLPSDTFDTPAKFKHWCNSVNLSFSGTMKDVEGIQYKLRTADVPGWDGTTIVGLHDDCFVLPEQTIGRSDLVYVEHPFGDRWKGATSLQPKDWEFTQQWPDHIFDLARLHKASVMTPILGWVAAAPLRSRCSKFPILAVSGFSGYGKTTIMETVLKAFGFWTKEGPFLPGMTPHAVVGAATTSNALPVWFDEYRDSVPPLTMAMVENVLRAAWDANSVNKGGTDQGNVMKVASFPVRAPLVVTGEESFTETSHAERMISVALSKEGRNFDALDRLLNDGEHGHAGLGDLRGFGRAYLDWLLSARDLDVKRPPWDTASRPQHCEAIARWGYTMLATFLDTYCGPGNGDVLPEFNYGSAKWTQQDVAAASPYDELIDAAEDAGDDRGFIVWEANGELHVRLEALYAWHAKNKTGITLPSRKPRDLRIYLQQQYGAIEDKNHDYGRCWHFPLTYDE